MFAQMFKGVDIVNALYWHGMSLALYFGRSFKKEGGVSMDSSSSDSEETTEKRSRLPRK
jgi:hypothetical protein